MTNHNEQTKNNITIVAMEKLLRRMAELTGWNSIGTAIVATELAAINLEKENYQRAAEIYEKFADIIKQFAIENKNSGMAAEWKHISTIMAFCYMHTDQKQKAIQIMEKNMAGWKIVLGENHPETIATMNNLATCYRSAGETEKAITLYEQAIPLVTAHYGETHENTLMVKHNLASAYYHAKQYDKAIQILTNALQLLQNVANSSEVKQKLARALVCCHMSAGHISEALRIVLELEMEGETDNSSNDKGDTNGNEP